MSSDSPWSTRDWMGGHGQAAYYAYTTTVGGRTPANKLMPTWAKLTDTDQAAWTMAALAAIARHTDITSSASARGVNSPRATGRVLPLLTRGLAGVPLPRSALAGPGLGLTLELRHTHPVAHAREVPGQLVDVQRLHVQRTELVVPLLRQLGELDCGHLLLAPLRHQLVPVPGTPNRPFVYARTDFSSSALPSSAGALSPAGSSGVDELAAALLLSALGRSSRSRTSRR
ncbi:hypothetical protein NKH18_01340 [Streptomyces sp. M10(2022)]